jgi:uncharacterized membrane protein
VKKFVIFIFIIFALTEKSQAECSIFIPVKNFWHAGYVIEFDFDSILRRKNFIEVENQDLSSTVLKIEGSEIKEQFFRYAFTRLSVSTQSKNYHYSYSVRCMTQLCGVSDFVKSFNKSMKSLLEKHPGCVEDNAHTFLD